MKKHDFTPEQSEIILNAVSEFIRYYGNACRPIKILSDFISDYILRMAADYPDEGIEPSELESIIFHTDQFKNLLFEIEEGRTANHLNWVSQ